MTETSEAMLNDQNGSHFPLIAKVSRIRTQVERRTICKRKRSLVLSRFVKKKKKSYARDFANCWIRWKKFRITPYERRKKKKKGVRWRDNEAAKSPITANNRSNALCMSLPHLHYPRKTQRGYLLQWRARAREPDNLITPPLSFHAQKPDKPIAKQDSFLGRS